MSDVVIDLNFASIEEDERLTAALDTFLLSHIDNGHIDSDAPEMMMRTVFSPDGCIQKKLIFQSRKWADAFVDFWESANLRETAA